MQALVQGKVADSYVEGDEVISEGTNGGPLQRFVLRLSAVEEDGSEIVVRRGGGASVHVRRGEDEVVGGGETPAPIAGPGRDEYVVDGGLCNPD